MGDLYRRHVAAQGFQQHVAAVVEANPQPKPGECVRPARVEVLLEQLAVIATPSTLQEQPEAWDQLAGVALVGMTPGLPPADLLDVVRAAAPR